MIEHDFGGSDRLERLIVERGQIQLERVADNRWQVQVFDDETDAYAEIILSSLSEIAAEVEEG